MNISGHTFKDHLRLLAPLFILITAVALLRFIFFAAHAAPWLVRSISVTITLAACVLLATVQIHVRRFGGYVNVVLATFLLVAWSQALIVMAIVISVLTGTENVFSMPEFSFPGPDPYHLKHIGGHLTFGIGGETLIGSAMGCLLLFLLRLLVPLAETGKQDQKP